MSLKSYLFILVGMLVLLLTASQLLLIQWLQDNVVKEIDMQSRMRTERVIDLAFLQLEKESTIVFKHQTEADANEIKVVTIDEDSVQAVDHINQAKDNIVSGVVQSKDGKLLKRQFKTITDEIHQLVKYDANIVNPVQQRETTWVIEKSETPSSLDTLITKIQWALVITALIAMVIAYWLSVKFIAPLKALTRGFSSLAIGDFKHDVQPQGVNEVRQTIEHFNQMKAQLASLAELEKNNQELQHLAELGDVSKGLAHALRNPIHTIGLSVEHICHGDLSLEQLKQTSAHIQTKISHINSTIAALLSLTSNGVDRTQQLPLLAIIQDIMLELKATALHQVNFDLVVPKGMIIKGGESEIRAILHTLMVNACDVSNSVEICINAQQNEQTKSIQIEVIDQGGGVPDSIAAQLFEPHVSSKPEGAGMGLYISKRLINLYYQGELTLVNNDIGGCTATAIFNRQNEL